MTHPFFATASLGTAPALAAELRELGLPVLEEQKGGVSFGRTLEDGYRACLWSRIASRVLKPQRLGRCQALIERGGARHLLSGALQQAVRFAQNPGGHRAQPLDVGGFDRIHQLSV